MELSRHPLIIKLRSLHLPPHDYVVAGSGPLLAHGLRQDLGDLDVVARGEAWERVVTMAEPAPASSGNGSVITLYGGDIEVFDQWLPGTLPADELIDGAEFIEGIPFCPLRTVLAWKIKFGRPKDHLDITLIKEYLAAHRST